MPCLRRAGGRSAGAPARRAARRRIHDVALRACVRTAGPQADERIDHERQRLEFDDDLLDRLGGGQFVDGGDGENRLAFVQRLHRQAAFALRAGADVLAERARRPAAPGRSSAVRIALTPGIASAALASMRLTRACGIGLSSSFAKSMPSARKSSAYFALPVTFATRSGVV